MKKLFIFLILFFNILPAFAEVETSTWKTTKTEINLSESEKLNNSYIYYYWDWCSHCMDLDAYFRKVGAYKKLDITKKEVWYDDKNKLEMLDFAKKLWLNTKELWTPFLIIKTKDWETSLSWTDKIIDYFKPVLWEWKTNAVFILIIVFILAIIIPTILIKLSNKK